MIGSILFGNMISSIFTISEQKGTQPINMCAALAPASVSSVRVILILMKVEISTSTLFQVVPFYSLISEHFLFSL